MPLFTSSSSFWDILEQVQSLDKAEHWGWDSSCWLERPQQPARPRSHPSAAW